MNDLKCKSLFHSDIATWNPHESHLLKHNTVSHWSECPSYKNLQTDAGESVKKIQASCTVHGNIHWYSYYRGQYGDSLKKKKKKAKSKSIIWPNNPITGHIPWENQNWKDTCIPVFIVALFTITRMWKQLRCPLADKQIQSCGIYIQWNITWPKKGKHLSRF